jgi:hypothetical protein
MLQAWTEDRPDDALRQVLHVPFLKSLANVRIRGLTRRVTSWGRGTNETIEIAAGTRAWVFSVFVTQQASRRPEHKLRNGLRITDIRCARPCFPMLTYVICR